MTLETLITDLKAAGCNENTLKLAMNCYEVGYERGEKHERIRLAGEIQKLPFGDTAQSFAVWVINGGQA